MLVGLQTVCPGAHLRLKVLFLLTVSMTKCNLARVLFVTSNWQEACSWKMCISNNQVTGLPASALQASVTQARLENLMVHFGLKSLCTKAQLKQWYQMLPLQ